MVQGMTLLFSLDRDCEQFAREITEKLNDAGLQVVRSFDLQDARAAHPGYTCPRHGSDVCDCQLIVLLLYSRDGPPIALVIHDHDGRSWAFLVDQPEQRVGARQKLSILRTLSRGKNNFVGQGKAASVA